MGEKALSKRAHILVLLVALSAFNQLDRQLTSVLLEQIRQEFALTDIQLGTLSGLAFVVLYAGLSIPASVAAAYGSRRNLVAISAAIWGGMTLFFGIAQSYWALLASRIGVGLGEAGVMPASHAIISDLCTPHERNGALAAWSGGINVGLFLAFLVGGVLGHILGWRAAFVGSGLVTLILAALATTIREPARSFDAERKDGGAPSWTLVADTAKFMTSDRPIRHIVAGSVLTAVAGYGDLAWASSFFQRVHGLSLAATGAYLAVVIGIIGGLGAIVGGILVGRRQRHQMASGFIAIAVAYAISRPFGVICYLTAHSRVALATFVPLALVGTVFVGPSLAMLHNRAKPLLRPTASALFLLLANVIGLGIGPLLVGAMSQLLFAASGSDSLGHAMAAMQVIGLWGSVHFFIAGRLLDTERLRPQEPVAS